jgi:hypothetical protein
MEQYRPAIRAVLTKAGSPDIQFEMRGQRGRTFEAIVDGAPGVFWLAFTPYEAMTGTGGPVELREAWEICRAKRFPEYTVTALEETVSA